MSTSSADLARVLDALTADRPQDAVIRARNALLCHPHDPRLHAALGIALCCLQEVDAALAALERAHYLAPDDARILYNYGLVLERAGRGGEARARLYAAIKLNPGYERALQHLARLPPVFPDAYAGLCPPSFQIPEPGSTDVLTANSPESGRPAEPAGGFAAAVSPAARWWRRREVMLAGAIATCGLLVSLFARSPSRSLAGLTYPGRNSHSDPGVHGNMVSARLAGSSFPGVSFDRVDLRYADLSRANLRGASFTGADLRHTQLAQAIMIGSVARGANFESAYLLGANLGNADLREANLTKAYVKAARMGRAQLDQANLRGTILSYADLSSASLRGADLTAACLKGTDLTHADMRGAHLHAADLRSASLRYVDLTGATYSQTTHWPTGFKPEQRGAVRLPRPP